MLTQSINASVVGNKVSPVADAAADQFCAITGHAGLVVTEFSYKKDEEIYGEDETAESELSGLPDHREIVVRAHAAPGPASEAPAWQHGIALLGNLKYPPQFARFDYVNARAPKAGMVRRAAVGNMSIR